MPKPCIYLQLWIISKNCSCELRQHITRTVKEWLDNSETQFYHVPKSIDSDSGSSPLNCKAGSHMLNRYYK